MIGLICGDCIDIMKGMIENIKPSFDMIFIDPPFTEWHASQLGKYNVRTLSYYVNRLLDKNGVVWLWGYIPQLINEWRNWDRWFKAVFDMIRVKPKQYPPPISNQMPIRAHENIWCLIKKETKLKDTKLWFKKKSKKIRERTRDISMRDDKRTKIFKNYATKVFTTSYQLYPSIGNTSREYYGHPTQKPERLVTLLIKSSTEEGDNILDPFAGSGTTLIVAENLNRNCLGIELSPEYCKIIKKRLRDKKEIKRLHKWLDTHST